ncbi:TPA: tRNA pseudouridine(38-40) synthase TruA [Candidatus Dependentiae bacterium]|nr:MAG: tRNA pseudouridine synthase A [candidate division TM6 bacterium GW2011_GWF2_36_131]KKQ03816.1 MAG: tRNA pseudouridine synthase A [candidate division TM6 bacterium GW2011_GWE2_36_25]HBR70584.1 tRNA pseudouridine(38-40) synthase TruA [Candidatus Dependentiae bacterium]HCU00700.1 tRNA pseudouridine(38-40) synthase TruA [Candidatus Dependentiae bacterium]
MQYKIIVAYDGTNYQGWQKQTNGPTVAETLEKVFFKVFHKKISLFAASRTDAGVHAEGQVATFSTDLSITTETLKNAWNNRLPESILIKELASAPDNYNPHHHILEKTYEYTIALQRPSPFVARHQWFYRWPLNIKKLEEVLAIFIGTHDFRSFCTGDDMKDTIRTINSITLQKIDAVTYKIIFKGPGFLRYMIRRIVGASLEIASRPKLTIDYLKKIKDTCNPEHTLPCAPARGLLLKSITYKN